MLMSVVREVHLLRRLVLVFSLVQCSAMAQQVVLSLNSGSSVPGGSTTLNLSLTTTGGAQPAGAQWTLTYSPSDISGISFAPGAASSAAGKSITCSSISGSTTCIDVGMNSNVIADGVLGLATVTLAAGTVDSSASIQMSLVVASTSTGSTIPGSGTGAAISISQVVGPLISGLSCNPSTVSAPGSSACTVMLNGPAPSAGVGVALSSNSSAVAVPASVTVPGGASNASFTATVGATGTSQAVTLTGRTGTSSQNFSLNVVAPLWTLSGSASAPGSGAIITLSGSAHTIVIADASGNYAFSNLSNGTYTVTPSKPGFVFTPPNVVVAINGANQTAVNFTPASMAFSANPSSGAGVFPTYTFTVSDPNSAANISKVSVLVTSGSTVASCYMVYTRATATVALYADDGINFSSKALGSSANLQNSQCAVGYTVQSVSGNSLVFTVQVLYKSSFFGPKTMYLEAIDSSVTSGWVSVGSWTAGYGMPAAVSAIPSSGAGVFPTYTMTVSDPASAANISSVGVLVTSGATTNTAASCHVSYDRASAMVELYADDGVSFTSKALGSSANLQNSQCAVGYTAESVSGNSVLFTLQVLYQTSFFGSKTVYLEAGEPGGASSGWGSVGSWAAGYGAPTAVSASPSSGTGVFPTYLLTVSDPSSAANITSVALLVTAGPATNTGGACYVVYNRTNATVGLFGDDGVSFSSKPIGSSANLENSQCAVGYAAGVVSGNSVQFTLQVLYKSGFSNMETMYLEANDSSVSSGWVNVGTWTR
jgi:hypothetical protein